MQRKAGNRRREPIRYVVEHVYSGKESMEKVLTAVSEEAAKQNVKEKLENQKNGGMRKDADFTGKINQQLQEVAGIAIIKTAYFCHWILKKPQEVNMQTTEIRETWTALYARLSLDDGNVGESMSIQSQKAILTEKQKNWEFIIIGFM